MIVQGIQSQMKSVRPLVAESGCYFLSLIRLSETIRKESVDKEWDVNGVAKFYDYCVSQGWMASNCFIQLPHKIVNYLSGSTYKGVEKVPYRDSGTYPYPRIICLKKIMMTHFVLELGSQVDNKLNIWDPLPPGRKGKEAFFPDSMRILA